MIPYKSNLSDKGCSPVSSNCVIYQGPCLSCINLQTGDSISDVTNKLAIELCALKEQLDLSDLDLKCLFEECALCPEPDKTLSAVLTLLINKVCSLEELIGIDPTDPETPALIRVAPCFQLPDLNGDLILDLPITDYVKSIGNKVCSLLTTVNQHTTTLANHETRITVLENATDPTTELPQVTPTCTFGSDTTPKDLDEMVSALEVQFCQFRAATGTAAELLQASAKQCVNLNTTPALSNPGNMATIGGWKNTVSTVADTINNMWLTICDMRAAVDAVQDCCAPTCADLTVNFLANVADNGSSLKLYFSGYTIIPSGFNDCAVQGSKLTITDGLSGSHIIYVPIVSASLDPAPITININTTPLNPTGNYTFTLESCLTDGSLTCNKTVIVNATGTPLSCNPPTNVIVSLV